MICVSLLIHNEALVADSQFRAVHILRGLVKVRHPRLLLESILFVNHSATYPDTFRMLSRLDYREGQSRARNQILFADACEGCTHINAMPTHPQILGQRCAWQMPIDADVVPLRRRHSPLRSRSRHSTVSSHRDLETAHAHIKEDCCGHYVYVWYLVSKLKMQEDTTDKFRVCGSALGTIVHTVELSKKVDKDLTWDGLDDQIWAVCDVNLASFASK